MKKTFIKKNHIIIVLAVFIVLYLLVALYFSKHYFFNTIINGVDVSLRSYEDAAELFREYVRNYELNIIERNGSIEKISGNELEMLYQGPRVMEVVYHRQNPLKWGISLFRIQNIFMDDLYRYSRQKLNQRISELHCMKRHYIEPQNVAFQYSNGSFLVIPEVYGDKIIKGKLISEIHTSIANGMKTLDLNEKNCYENPRYTVHSQEAIRAKKTLDHYVSAKIVYQFGSRSEVLNGRLINRWLSLDDAMNVKINKRAIINYINILSKKYDTVGVDRNFITSYGRTVVVHGGLYGWKINQEAEVAALEEIIKQGITVEKEPEYVQKAVSREENDIGDTYVEVNITRQHLWFYIDGKLVCESNVVTGNPNRGFATAVGTYMLVYKQKGATLTGPGYSAEVDYWMPFYGSMGLHDARWRHSFGGEIYKRRGTHGCVNLPYHIAETIFHKIEEGTPIVLYEEGI
ncbi:peptidoglycan binding domain-containing protein [Lachnospiraceae bacterium MD1]|uniref:Peptidoglycan binding domain-containing protein n=1 Tax=Variimorphobacter saccharofermentans TaxID=2755051 RepID=A0A839K536_9FIRM|nr:L,D-transpeptidase family protein [Variimorphobacter saccharofermentans]MBB2184457.1 peptidoglycan binding domain-containing protein [Variimorphobacter saccharofermentans]